MSRTDEKCLSLLRARYRRASKKEKSAILNEFVKRCAGKASDTR